MRASQIAVCTILGLIGFVTFILGLVADGARQKISDVTVADNVCYYARTIAFTLGLVGALLILISQILANIAGGCICRGARKPRSRGAGIAAVLVLVLSWALALTVMVLFLIGAFQNNQSTRAVVQPPNICWAPTPGRQLAVAGCLALVTVFLQVVYYLLGIKGTVGQQDPMPGP